MYSLFLKWTVCKSQILTLDAQLFKKNKKNRLDEKTKQM